MAGTIRQDQRDGMAIIRLALPPLNTLTPAMRQELGDALDAAILNSDIGAIVLTGLGQPAARGLSAGLDLREAEAGITPPHVSDLCQRVEMGGKPVVAVLHGMTLGAGVELALAAHARVGTADAFIGFPDVMMGLPPAAGATQYLPRLLGAQTALELLLSQNPRRLRGRHLRPLVDSLVPEGEDVEAAAFALAQKLAAGLTEGRPLQRSRDRRDGLADFAGNAAAIAARRTQVAASPNTASARIVDCVEAACLLPFEAGLAFENVAFEELLEADVSKSLRHAFFAERRAANFPELRDGTARSVSRVALIGGGTVAANMAVAFLAAGLPVIHFERSADALVAVEGRIAASHDALVKAGRMQPDHIPDRLALWQGTTQLGDLAQADLLIEAVADSLSTKTVIMGALDRIAPPQAVLVTTSSLFRIDQIAAATTRPAAVLGLRLQAPAHLTRLAEICPSDTTSADAIATVAAMLRDSLGRIVLRNGTGGGGMGEPVIAALWEAGAGMLRQGASPLQIDAALHGYGFAQGIFRQIDLIGLEHCLAKARVAEALLPVGTRHLNDMDRLIMAGRTGQRAGRGFYLWQEGQGQPDRAVMGILDLTELDQQGAATSLSAESIVLRAVAAMANAGARALRAGFALRPSDIDTVMMQGHGYPRWHGGPMKAADLIGLFEIRQALERFSEENPALYTPDPVFAALIKEGQNFDSLNRAEDSSIPE
ncbi:MAG: 3-hydroxyacyl-CoA dehydrogenase NAD-binding domain-containing protein [Paracoccaceae bacterium]